GKVGAKKRAVGPRSRSQVLSAPRGRVLPHLVAIVVEHQAGIGRRRVPDVAGEVALELTGPPAGVTEGDEALLRARVAGDVAQNLADLAARRGRQACVDIKRPGAAIISAVNHEGDLRLDRTAEKYAHIAGHGGVLCAERCKKVRQWSFAQRLVD